LTLEKLEFVAFDFRIDFHTYLLFNSFKCIQTQTTFNQHYF